MLLVSCDWFVWTLLTVKSVKLFVYRKHDDCKTVRWVKRKLASNSRGFTQLSYFVMDSRVLLPGSPLVYWYHMATSEFVAIHSERQCQRTQNPWSRYKEITFGSRSEEDMLGRNKDNMVGQKSKQNMVGPSVVFFFLCFAKDLLHVLFTAFGAQGELESRASGTYFLYSTLSLWRKSWSGRRR